MKYMVIERYKEGAIREVYCRFAERGRMMPDGLRYIESWVSPERRVCYQLMETEQFDLFSQWTRNWDDLVDFEIVPVISSQEARAMLQDESED
jgi:hypothetical protein